MAKAVIELNGKTATVEDGDWQSEDPGLLGLVNAINLPDHLGYYPCYESAIALEVCIRLDATLISVDLPEAVEGRIY